MGKQIPVSDRKSDTYYVAIFCHLPVSTFWPQILHIRLMFDIWLLLSQDAPGLNVTDLNADEISQFQLLSIRRLCTKKTHCTLYVLRATESALIPGDHMRE